MSTTQLERRTKQTGIETILLAVGPSDADRIERLAEETIDVAGPTGATVVLAHVFTDEEFAQTKRNLDISDASEAATADTVAQRHSTIRSLAQAFDEADVDYEIRGAVGVRGEEIVTLADDVGADRVVVGGRHRSPTGKAVFGSTAQEVMLESPAPVTFVRADTR